MTVTDSDRPAIIPSRAASFLCFDGMVWPNPNDPNEVQWRLRYGKPTREDILFAASVMSAYSQLVADPQRRRNEKVRGLREAMCDA